ncbi:hypothetical protein FI667_g11327, partial [Globisporangium splendens]
MMGKFRSTSSARESAQEASVPSASTLSHANPKKKSGSASSLSSSGSDNDNDAVAVHPSNLPAVKSSLSAPVHESTDEKHQGSQSSEESDAKKPSTTTDDAKPTLSVKPHQQPPKFVSVAKGLLLATQRATSPPRARAATTAAADGTSEASSKKIVTAFGKFQRRSSATTTTVHGEDAGTVVHQETHDSNANANLGQQQQQSLNRKDSVGFSSGTRATPVTLPKEQKPEKVSTVSNLPTSKAQHTISQAKKKENTSENSSDGVTEEAGDGFVNEVRNILDQLVVQLDGVDPKKLCAIRLGGELRGLLGKAQDEFYAYETAFREHAAQVGVSIALQNFSASLLQVFDIVARLQPAKSTLLLNKKFKREVLFAFQEINSYYTSLFMELSMAVAKRSGIVLPLPSPVKVQPPPPVVEEEEPVPLPPKVEEVAVVEPVAETVAGINLSLGFYRVVGDLLENSKFLKDKSAALRFYSKAAKAIPVCCHVACFLSIWASSSAGVSHHKTCGLLRSVHLESRASCKAGGSDALLRHRHVG